MNRCANLALVGALFALFSCPLTAEAEPRYVIEWELPITSPLIDIFAKPGGGLYAADTSGITTLTEDGVATGRFTYEDSPNSNTARFVEHATISLDGDFYYAGYERRPNNNPQAVLPFLCQPFVAGPDLFATKGTTTTLSQSDRFLQVTPASGGGIWSLGDGGIFASANAQLWQIPHGSVADDQIELAQPSEIAAGPGSLLYEVGRLNSTDSYVRRYDTSLPTALTTEVTYAIGGSTRATDLFVDSSGSVFVFGQTTGDFDEPVTPDSDLFDVFVAKYDANLNQQWIQQYGTNGSDQSLDFALDPAGNLYLAISDNEPPITQGIDVAVLKLDPAGELLWEFFLGSPNTDRVEGVYAADNGDLYLAYTELRSGADYFSVIKLTPPKPGDFSGDGSVDNDDLNLLLANWGAAIGPFPDGWEGDEPTPSGIDNDELNALLANWGVGVTAIPEPGALTIALGVVAAWGRKARTPGSHA